MTQIGDYTFSSCEKLKEVDIPGDLLYLGRGAFERCYSLTNVIIRDGLEVIQENTFNYCHSLNEVSLSHSLKQLRKGCFNSCGDITIYYKGTKEEWKNLYKPLSFKDTYFICECTDGKVVKKRK